MLKRARRAGSVVGLIEHHLLHGDGRERGLTSAEARAMFNCRDLPKVMSAIGMRHTVRTERRYWIAMAGKQAPLALPEPKEGA